MRRAFVIVLDACGAGELPDAADYGDAGASTLAHVAEATGGLDLPTLGALGLGSIVPIAGVPPAAAPVLHARLHPLGPGKDTITGHWELMGVVTPAPMRTYPEGFPEEVLARLRGHRAGDPLQPALQRHACDRRLGRSAPRDRRPGRLQVRGLRAGLPPRRCRRSTPPSRAGCRACARTRTCSC